MLKRTFLTLVATALGATMLMADGGAHTSTPPTPAQLIAAKVARLTVLLTLTTAQQTTATTIFTTEQTAEAALVTPTQTAQTALETAIKANDVTGINTQATALANLAKQDILADATAQAAFYAQLTTAQRTIYDNMRLAGLDGPGGH